MTRPERPDGVVPALIVGAGPVGVSAAILLAQRGVSSLIVDRYADPYPLPRAVHLDDEIYRVLADMGVAEQFAKITMPTLGLRLIDSRQRTMAEFTRSEPIGQFGFPPGNMFDQPDLERILRERLAGLAEATLLGGTELVGIESNSASGPVRVRLRELASGEEYVVAAGAVLGCDGANSTVRTLIGSTMEDLGFEERWFVADVRCEQPLPIWRGAHQLCDPARAGTLMQVGPTRYRWEFRLKDLETADDLLNSGTFAALVRPWLGGVPFEDLELIRHAEYTFKARIADKWRDGRIFLLGDAAHLTPPFIGQGLCAGLRDAANLTWKLAAVLTDRADESLLDSYEPERVPHARSLVKKAVKIGWVMTGGQDAAAGVRRVAFAIAAKVPGASDKVLDTTPPRFPDTGAIRRLSRRDKLTGGQIPQPFVRVGGSRVRLDTVTGVDHAVIVVGEPDPSLVAAARQCGATLLRVVPGGQSAPTDAAHPVVVDQDGTLLRWFARGRAAAALVRPDHAVQACEPVGPGALVGRELGNYLVAWAQGLSWGGQASVPSGGAA